MSEPQAPAPTPAPVRPGQPIDPFARRRERIAAATARKMGEFAGGRQAATAEARAASQAAAKAEAAEIENLLAMAGRMTVLPSFAIAKAAEALKASTQNVSDWRLTLEGHVFDRNAAEVAKARTQLGYWIERAQFDQNRLLKLAGVPLFPEQAKSATAEPPAPDPTAPAAVEPESQAEPPATSEPHVEPAPVAPAN